MSGVRRRIRDLLFLFPAALGALGLVDRQRAEEAFDLAVPVMVTGGLRTMLRTADFFMVSRAIGGQAVAALELGFQYYFIPFGLSLALSSGTISVVSRFKGAGEDERANVAVTQSLWLALLVSVPVTAFTWVYAEPLLDVLTNDPRTIAMGATYLRIVMLSVGFRFWSMIASRALAGSGNTRTPMYVRSLTLPTNIALDAILIYGLGPFEPMGVAGAAWGTAAANALAGTIFFVLMLSDAYDVSLSFRGRRFDATIAREIVRVGLPLAATRLSRTLGRFPFLFVLATLGTPVVAAYAIGRRVMLLAMMPAWGYSTASSTLVGQHVGAGDDEEADAYGWQTLRIALVTQLLIAVVLAVFATPIAHLFRAANLPLTVAFVRVFAVGVAAFSVSRTMRGGLRGAGDTTWPFYGTVAGTYLLKLPIAFTALPVGFGIVSVAGATIAPGFGFGLAAVYAAILADMYLRATVNLLRFRSGAWKTVARRSVAGADPTE